MLSNEERELQIELARLQIKHDHVTSRYTVLLSVMVSLMVTAISVYIPLAVVTGNSFYLIFPTVFVLVLAIPLYLIGIKLAEAEKNLESEIQELKKKYLW
jgi:hypothetical protein